MLHSILANAIPHLYQCDYPLVTHSFIRTKPPIPQPLLTHPSGITTSVHASTNNRSARKQTKEILFVCDKEQHMIHCLQMTFAHHSVRSKGRHQGIKLRIRPKISTCIVSEVGVRDQASFPAHMLLQFISIKFL